MARHDAGRGRSFRCAEGAGAAAGHKAEPRPLRRGRAGAGQFAAGACGQGGWPRARQRRSGGEGALEQPEGGSAYKVRAGSGEGFRDVAAPWCPEMVVVPAGSYTMGTWQGEIDRLCAEDAYFAEVFQREAPQYKVTITKPLAVGRCAITLGEFSAFVQDTGYAVPDEAWTYEDFEWKLRDGRSFRNPNFAQDDSHPVVCVNWNDARVYVQWLSRKTGKLYRLLSEAEWEYASRSGSQTPFRWGSSISTVRANYNGNTTFGGSETGECRWRTVPVKSFQPNSWGLYQVHGNVWEWCEDCWNENLTGAPIDGSARTTGDCGRRVLRGGSWDGFAHSLRSASRERHDADEPYL